MRLRALALAAAVAFAAAHGLGAGASYQPGGSAGCGHLERLWDGAGGNPAQAQTAASIAMAESGGNADATSANSNGTTDRGYWQINSTHGALSTYDPQANAQAAVQISGNGQNFTPWTTYDSGAYAGRC